ncbi:MAG: DUF3179 domain-containing protein [Pseudomonadota bacterium]
MLTSLKFAAVFLAASTLICAVAGSTASAQNPTSGSAALGFDLFSPINDRRSAAIKAMVKAGKRDVIPALILAFRYEGLERHTIHNALETLTGTKSEVSWREWMIWQETNSTVRAFKGFDRLIASVMSRHDPNFSRFLYAGMPHEIRLGEITWGGVVVDGIPPLDRPRFIGASEAAYLNSDDLVFGIEINGDIRAYPLRIMDWHEMFNDVIGGVPVSLAYCTLCGSGILFEGRVDGRATPFAFGSSGLLYRSNKLMYDRETYSLWNQFTGRPVAGPLTGSGIELKTRPVAITTWADWKATNPTTKVLSKETGHNRDYSPNRAYGSYFASPDLMFPADTSDARLKPKDYVFALRGAHVEKAWPLARFAETPVINDQAGVLNLTLVGDAKTRTVRAYRTKGQAFQAATAARTLALGNETWRVTEGALVGPNGETLPRLPGHVSYWFAWSGYLGKDGEFSD